MESKTCVPSTDPLRVRGNCHEGEERVIVMNADGTVFGNAAGEATTPSRILQIALAAWRQGNFAEVVDQFNDQFTFTDHAVGLEFKDKGRLTEFLMKISERFPDLHRKAYIIFGSGDRVTSEWSLTARRVEPFLVGRRKITISVRGVSVVRIKNGKISQWADYYDQLKTLRYDLVARLHRAD